MNEINSSRLSKDQKGRLIAELRLETAQNQIDNLFPDTGPLRRELYTKHLEFFRSGHA
jgi:hypothetical protein